MKVAYAKLLAVAQASYRLSMIPHPAVAPNPSIERTRYGVALRPRGAGSHVAPRGLRATPPRAAHVER